MFRPAFGCAQQPDQDKLRFKNINLWLELSKNTFCPTQLKAYDLERYHLEQKMRQKVHLNPTKKTVNTNGQFVIVISVVANFSNTQKMVVSSF